MRSEHTFGTAEAVLSELKDFQVKTAEYAFHRLYEGEDSTRRFLVADEAGLGKTLVAAGVIARAIEHLQKMNTERIDIIYICSNQAIARQNVDRIKRRLAIETRPLAERITLLPHRLATLDQPINLIALTPGTSFNSASAEGVVEERIILFRMLSQVWGNLGPRSRRVFLGGLASVSRFRDYERWYWERDFDESILQRFENLVGGRNSQLHQEFMRVLEYVAYRDTTDAKRRRRRFVARMRRFLAHACLDALDPDLVILDEFQRFRHLLNPKTESGELAQRLFEYEDEQTRVRTLLLSATPYKMYTFSEESEDDHYRDFLQTVEFLGGGEGSVGTLEESLREFRWQMPSVASNGRIDVVARNRLVELKGSIQSSLLKVMSRTERRGAGGGGDPMLAVSETAADLDVSDVGAYLSARELAAVVDAPGVMEYWKSTPYMLSFMDQYRLSDRLRNAAGEGKNGDVARIVESSPGIQLPRRSASDRQPIAGGNGRMRSLLQDFRDSGLQKLLWLPPTLTSHGLGRDFENARDATKRLVFSSWAMVPRAIAIMTSYDAEREYIPDPARASRYVSQGLRMNDDAFSLFSMIVPSTTLADVGNPYRYTSGISPDELLRMIESQLRPKVIELTRDAPREGAPQQIWYAVAPLMLDGLTSVSVGQLEQTSTVRSGGEDTDAAEATGWRRLTARVRDGLANPGSLGRPPGNLLQVLAALAAGSPANATLRSLSRVTGNSTNDENLKKEAMRAAWYFRAFFQTPTSEGLLQNVYEPGVAVGEGNFVWQRVLAYALEGGLSDVLDEYFYVIRESRGDEASPDVLVNRLSDALHLATGRLDATEWKTCGDGLSRETYPMRQHIARRYVSDPRSSADQQASQHLDVVRAAFNSPFWPFVLGTTSVGQEGLDFHWYCHAVVHWNLPSNPVDLEQREGRVHRYHGHAVRKNIAQAVGPKVLERVRGVAASGGYLNPWKVAYQIANNRYEGEGGLVPNWVFTEGNARIQRHTPVLPLSRDEHRLEALRRTLAVYRMVFGQPRQDDFLEFILREVPPEHQDSLAAALTIDLRPQDSR